MTQAEEAQTEQSGASAEESRETHPGGCPVAWCPFCFAVGAVQPLQPEVIEHLLKAGTEMLLAFRAVVDGRADAMTPDKASSNGRVKVEKIDIG